MRVEARFSVRVLAMGIICERRGSINKTKTADYLTRIVARAPCTHCSDYLSLYPSLVTRNTVPFSTHSPASPDDYFFTRHCSDIVSARESLGEYYSARKQLAGQFYFVHDQFKL